MDIIRKITVEGTVLDCFKSLQQQKFRSSKSIPILKEFKVYRVYTDHDKSKLQKHASALAILNTFMNKTVQEEMTIM